MPLPLLLKAAVLGGAAYAATRWYAAHRQANHATPAVRSDTPGDSELTTDSPNAMPWPSGEEPVRPSA
jgi:hypothetical protein